MPIYSRAAPQNSVVTEEKTHISCPPIQADDSPPSSWTPSSLDPDSVSFTAPTSPHLSPSTSQAPSCKSEDWDINTTFPEYSWLWPSSPNGTWLSCTMQRPSSALSSIDVPALTRAISEVGDAISDRLTHAFDGRDLPAMHDRAVSYLTPSMSMPSLREVGRGMDRVADCAQEWWGYRRRRLCQSRSHGFELGSSPVAFSAVDREAEEGEHLGTIQFAFADAMAAKAKRALIEQGICTEYQTNRTGSTLSWHRRLDSALASLFRSRKEEYGADALFDMTPVWIPDAEAKVWRLQLDTGIVDVIAQEEYEEWTEQCICLDVDFALFEDQGLITLDDVEQEVREAAGEGMAVWKE
ncbi:hypothetical protein DE146DRAFT_757792 [Phaeosphaeria sp. MPI-PUGE-AT-0046c]|nr:hypothetical protein DE146DRAFT_757792 [Phaeosphaeria sp. MPI-PUGE-AT-0046c]